MAVRQQFNYCTNCGMPLSARGGEPVYFCRSCGHGLRDAPPSSDPSPGPPVLVLVADPPHHGRVRRAGAAAVDVLLAGFAGLVAGAVAAQLAVIVQGAHTAGGVTFAWIIGAGTLLAYQPVFWACHRRTPGMQLFGLRPKPPYPPTTAS